MKRIDPNDLVDVQKAANAGGIPFRAQVVYAWDDNFLGEPIYRPDARLWLHRTLADIVLKAAQTAADDGFLLIATDGLRTVDAQQRMMETKIARANPHWTADGPMRMLSPPGAGGHPRGMAVDVVLEKFGELVDMGTDLDDMSPASARAFRDLPRAVLDNRAYLESLMLDAARSCRTPLLPLPSEWWDFRLPAEVYEQYAPLNDAELPPEMRMCS